MAEIVGIASAPLSGARMIEHDSAFIGPSGLVDDHRFSLYKAGPNDTLVRVSQKQHSVLAQLIARVDDNGLLSVRRDPELDYDPWHIDVALEEATRVVEVDEFGDLTPCWDMGEAAAAKFSDLLDEDVRLGRKTDRWMNGHLVRSQDRRVAPLHAIFTNSVAELRRLGGTAMDFGADRFRPNLLIDPGDVPPFFENLLVGSGITVGNVALRGDRLTARCPVPAHDQKTGENRKDVSTLYPHLPKMEGNKGKPVMGIYLSPVMLAGAEPIKISVGDEVRFG